MPANATSREQVGGVSVQDLDLKCRKEDANDMELLTMLLVSRDSYRNQVLEMPSDGCGLFSLPSRR
jgi:hypothetical protein